MWWQGPNPSCSSASFRECVPVRPNPAAITCRLMYASVRVFTKFRTDRPALHLSRTIGTIGKVRWTMKRYLLATAGAVLLIMPAQPAGAFELQSPDIHNGAPIAPEQVYTRCGGQNVSPALVWRDAPTETKSFAVTAIDHNAPPNDWSHWILIDIPPGVTLLAKGAAPPAGAHA